MIKKADRITSVFSFMYMSMICFGVSYTLRHFEKSMPWICYVLLAVISFVAVYAVLARLCRLLSGKGWWRHKAEPRWFSSKKCVAVRFLIIWIPLFIIFLNMYPGTLCADENAQIMQALGDLPFENSNPFINTMIVKAFAKLGMRIKDISLGVAMYTFFQITLYSAVATYVLTVLDKIKLHIAVRVLCMIFFICPINMIYAISMWKDTFFALVFMFTLAYALNLFITEQEIPVHSRVVLAVMSVIAALARNSGWTSLLVGALILLIYGKSKKRASGETLRKKCRVVALCEITGVLAALVVIGVIYPLAGIKTVTDSYMYTSIQMQQLSRVIVDDVCSESEIEMLKSIYVKDDAIERIKNNYVPTLVDSVRGCYDASSSRFWSVWFRIGLSHPIEYFKAAADHTVNYWCPFSSSWLVDFRIFVNPYGIERTPLIFKNINLAQIVYKSVFYFIPIAALSNSGCTFWVILLCIYLCLKSKNGLGCVLCMPYLMVYAGLFLISYGCLFRYTYSAVLGMPLLLGFYNIGKKCGAAEVTADNLENLEE